MHDFDRFNREFDEQWSKAERRFSAWFAFVVVLNIAWMAVAVWAIVQLVQWATSK